MKMPPAHPPESHEGFSMKVTLLIQVLVVAGLVVFLVRRDWENVFLTVIVIGLLLLPLLLRKRYRINLPPEFQLLAALFVFLTLFLGSAIDWYYKFWWWDMVLHTGSGFLLGIIGFLAIFLLNQTDRLPQGMKPVFVCMFAVTFAVFLGVIWEIFEWMIDKVAPWFNMQSTETGVDDTMHDLIVDTLGAVIVAAMGWAYMKTGRYSFIADAVRGFVERNPRLFRGNRGSEEVGSGGS